ncbi:3D domain-containing protein [Cohnella caldifontis]|uniref:3D domain-containing protein n=1 Tax=Cohnella caldifontis TaxID=3027471 RepID=UPI0023EB2074|nr:3D domain-containing protein [Cohnella sp. YIM B05605]
MGLVPIQEPHVPRPTGKLIAAKWKHEHLRLILISAILSFAVVVMFNSLLRGASAKSVTVVDGSQTVTYQTWSADVAGFLEEKGIHVGPFDRVSLSLAAPLQKDGLIVIERAKQFTIQEGGKQQVKYTTERTVGEALAALNIPLDNDDRVIPAVNDPVEEGSKIRVVRVRTETIESQTPIAYSVVQKKDASLEAGKQKVVTTGKTGVLVKKLERVFEDGKLVREQVVDEEVAKPAIQQVVAVGTKKAPVTLVAKKQSVTTGNSILKLNGKTVAVKRVLNNVTLTAYSAGPASTGKKKGDSGYGITSSGTKVQEGRTIAVDPDIIPMGWWVYIEGIGFRRAEDTGSAVNGKKIDIYYDSESRADKFGLKRGYTVYVIGPNKPTAD